WLFKPATAWRIRPGSDEGTPLPPETAAGENPPDGAMIYYYLKNQPRGPLVLEIYDERGNRVRRYSSADHAPKVNPSKLNIPAFWVHPPQPPSAQPGMHRFEWNLRYAATGAPRNPFDPFSRFSAGPWAPPGAYAVKMSVDGRTQSQSFALKLDPRVKTSNLDLQRQFELATRINQASAQASATLRSARELPTKLKQVQSSPRFKGKLVDAANALTQKLSQIMGGASASNPDFSGVEGRSADQSSLRYVTRALGGLEFAVESADVAPTPDAERAFKLDQSLLQKNLDVWSQIEHQDLPQLNALLAKAHLQAIELGAAGKGEGKP
ncbi:MAG: hypothetical protein ACRD3T_07390, partial [Terriglobia bacterium]